MTEVKTKLLAPSLTSQYTVNIYTPPGGPQLPEHNQDVINLSCSEASLPGSNLMTHELKDDFVGTTEKIAYRKAYDATASFTFYVNTGYNVILFFEDWIRYIAGEPLIGDKENTDHRASNFVHRTQFKKYYKSQIVINKFEKNYEKNGTYLEYSFIDAYPLSINSMPVSYNSSELLKCTVNYTFTRYVLAVKNFAATTSSNSAESSSNVSGSIGSVENFLNNTDGNGNYVNTNPSNTSNTSQQIDKYMNDKPTGYNSPSTGSIKEMGKYTNY